MRTAPSQTKYLSVISDDFGWSAAVNRGIRVAFTEGILTDASVMANAPGFAEAVDLAKGHGISVAAHVNLLRGAMLTGGAFPRSVVTLWRKARHPQFISLIEREARAQIETILRAGTAITQLNSEKHSHLFPRLFRLWVQLAQEYHIPCVRFIREFNADLSIQGAKANLLSVFSVLNRHYVNARGLTCPDHFVGIRATGSLDARAVTGILCRLRPGWTELMVHVGYPGPIDATMGTTFLQDSRAGELSALTDPSIAGVVRARGVVLRDLGGRAKYGH